MSALTKPFDNQAASSSGDYNVLLSAGVDCYPGAGMVWNAGYAEPATKATGLKTIGALKSVRKITGGAADGDVPAVVEGSHGPTGARTYVYDNDTGGTPVTQADVPCDVYWQDDHTVSASSSGASKAGEAIEVLESGAKVRIRFDR